MLPLVSEQRREQTLRYKHTLGQFCCLKSWLMLEELLEYRIQNTEYRFNPHGKPFIEGGPHFSISHCKEGIAVAVNDKPIGVDIEAIRHADAELIARTMNEKEKFRVESLELRDRDRAFTRLWTQKEAVVKWRGTGIESFEQLQNLLIPSFDRDVNKPDILQTFEKENYIYSIAYGY